MNLDNKIQKLLQLWRKFLPTGSEIFIGADVSKDNLCIWADRAETPTSKLKPYWEDVRGLLEEFGEHKRRFEMMRVYANTEGVAILRHLNQEYKIKYLGMEPTGTAYSKLWLKVCEQENIPVRWLGHVEVANFRRSNRLPNKNDLADAVAIYYYLATYVEPDHYLELCAGELGRVREIYLQLGSLARIQSPVVNRLRQQLASEFPEMAKSHIGIGRGGFSPFAQWIATGEKNTRYDRIYESSIAPQYGIEISQFSRRLAQIQIEVHLWESTLETELSCLLSNPVFKNYNDAFNKLEFGLRTRAIVLSQIYPVEKFAKVNRITGKYNYSKSLAAFKQRLGYGGEEISSGDVDRRRSTGSKLARKALYLWALTKVAVKSRRPRSYTLEFKRLCEFYDQRMAAYNYDDWVETQKVGAVRSALTKLLKSLPPQVVPLIENFMDGSEPVTKQSGFDARRGYGSLVLSHTAARAVKTLFRMLTK